MSEGYSANYRIEVNRENNNDTFDVFVELLPEDFDDTIRVIASKEKELQNAIKNMVGISPRVHLTAPNSIERSEGKAVRVIDRRNLQKGRS